MDITLENYETIINSITIVFIIENGKLLARKKAKEWMQKKEYIRYCTIMDIQSVNEMMNFLKKHNLTEYEEGTTARNMMESMGENMRLARFLYKRVRP